MNHAAAKISENPDLLKFNECSTIGLDAGTFSLKAAGIIEEKIDCFYKIEHRGHIKHWLDFFTTFKNSQIALVKNPCPDFKIVYDPTSCLIEAVLSLFPKTLHIFHLGASDLFYISLNEKGQIQHIKNQSLCAAGSGSFLDMQAQRLGITYQNIEKIKPGKDPPYISTRCAVFAKSDLVFRQQEGDTIENMWSGLCRGLADNVLNTLVGAQIIRGEIIISGGVALNKTFIHWLREIIKSRYKEILLNIIPKPDFTLAKGAALLAKQNIPSDTYLCTQNNPKSKKHSRPVLFLKTAAFLNPVMIIKDGNEIQVNNKLLTGTSTRVYLGIDIGSMSTKLVLINHNRDIILSLYRKTAGQPIDATQKLFSALYSLIQEYKMNITVCGVATTGSGRKLIGEIIGADVIINEVSAHVRGTLAAYSEAETVFEIGGQDSKYMHIKNGQLVDMNMNYGCAAGTGAFIEELAEKLNYSVQELAENALGVTPPLTSSRCTVFMEQDIRTLQLEGFSRRQIAAAVLYSICENYLERVVGWRFVNKRRIVFQGATARNRALVAAFENILGTKLLVSPNCHVMGALGAALYAIKQKNTKFRGFDLAFRQISLTHKNCTLCKNYCHLSHAVIEGEKKPLIFGMKCGRDPNQNKKQNILHYTVFAKTERIYHRSQLNIKHNHNAPVIGLPLSLTTKSMSPFWSTFFQHVGLNVRWSRAAHREFIDKGNTCLKPEMCLPAKACCGQILSLLQDKKVDLVFAPHILADNQSAGLLYSKYCPYICVLPSLVPLDSPSKEKTNKRLISPVLNFQWENIRNVKRILKAFAPSIKLKLSAVKVAFLQAQHARKVFELRIQAIGTQVLKKLNTTNQPTVVIIGHPYVIFDKQINKDLPYLIASLGVSVISMPCIPFKPQLLEGEFRHLFWISAQHIISSLIQVAQTKGLYSVYLSSYGCGPDTLLLSYAESIMGAKPFLSIELDEHGSSGAYQTRIEAFIEVIKSDWATKKSINSLWHRPVNKVTPYDYKERSIWIPPMHSVGNRLFAATFRSFGYFAQTLPQEGRESYLLGKKCTRGGECLPAPLVLGTFLYQMNKEKTAGGEPNNNCALFLPTSHGPCRYGEYRTLDRFILDKLGYDHLPILPAHSQDGDENFNDQFQIKLWESVIASDILYHMRCFIKPYENKSGETENTLEQLIQKAEKLIEHNQINWKIFLSESMREFKKISITKKWCPLVGIVGEIYLRFNEFGNNGLVNILEDLGAEVWISPISEWILYTIWIDRYMNGLHKKNIKQSAALTLKWLYMSTIRNRLIKIVEPFFPNRREPNIHEIIRQGQTMVPLEFEGESLVAIGRAKIFQQNGADLVVNCSSFGCMHGNITTTLFDLYRDASNIPVLECTYDGMENDHNLGLYIKQAIRDFGERKKTK